MSCDRHIRKDDLCRESPLHVTVLLRQAALIVASLGLWVFTFVGTFIPSPILASTRAWEAIEQGNPVFFPGTPAMNTGTGSFELKPGTGVSTGGKEWGVTELPGALISVFPDSTLQRNREGLHLESGMLRVIAKRRIHPVVLQTALGVIRIREGICLLTDEGGNIESGSVECGVGKTEHTIGRGDSWGKPVTPGAVVIPPLQAIEHVWRCTSRRAWLDAADAGIASVRALSFASAPEALRSLVTREAMIALAHQDNGPDGGFSIQISAAFAKYPEAWYDAFERCLRYDETVTARNMYRIFAPLRRRAAMPDLRELIIRRLVIGNHAEPLPEDPAAASAAASLGNFWHDSWTYLALVSCSVPIKPEDVTAYLTPERFDTLGPRISRQRLEAVARRPIGDLEPQGLHNLIRMLWKDGQASRARSVCAWFAERHAGSPWLTRAQRFLDGNLSGVERPSRTR